MKFILKLHPEITIKSKSVRKRFTKLLDHNIRNVFKTNDLSVEVRNQWDKLLLLVNPSALDKKDQVMDIIQRIPGIEKALLVEESSFTDLDDIYQQVKAVWQDMLKNKTFAVRVKRRGQHSFSSMDIARYVGGGLNQHCDSKGVKLQNPDVTVEFEVEDDTLIMVKETIPCLGGMPLPSQEDVLSLISGGFDSGVSTFQMIRRGARTHFCFFNLGGRDHEIGVKQVSYYLWQRYSQSHRVKFIAVDFEPIITDILENVENGQMGVVLKRMMMRAASKVADGLGINALVTGESLGQVSSQTMTNLHVIDQSTSKLILRPLICMDKQEIIDIARHIGTEDFAKVMPEYCGVISRKPTVKAQLDCIEAEEAKCDLGLIDQAVRAANVVDIRSISEEAEQEVASIDSVDSLTKDAVVLDIRSPEEQEHKPLDLPQFDVLHIPFYRLATQFPDLDQSREYFLYCDRGVMSKMQALILHEKGYTTVKVYRP